MVALAYIGKSASIESFGIFLVQADGVGQILDGVLIIAFIGIDKSASIESFDLAGLQADVFCKVPDCAIIIAAIELIVRAGKKVLSGRSWPCRRYQKRNYDYSQPKNSHLLPSTFGYS